MRLMLLVIGFLLPFVLQAQWVPDGKAICTTTNFQSFPAIVSDGSGSAIIIWEDYRNGNCDVYAQRVDAAGFVQWIADGMAICTAPHDQREPIIVADGSGDAIIAWHDDRANTYYDIYAQRVNISGVIQWPANGVAICTAAGNQFVSAIVPDGSGGTIITWDDRRGGNSDVYAQRVDSLGMVKWDSNGTAICVTSGNQGGPAMVTDGSGGAIITWGDDRNGDFDIYAQRVDSSGITKWTTNGMVICGAVDDQLHPTIVADGTGGAIITWEDFRGSIYDIYAQRVDSLGMVKWDSNGIIICTAAGNQTYPTIAADGSGGAIIIWDDNRSSSNGDIYAQRVDSAGNIKWIANGIAICSASEDQAFPAIIADSSGGTIITWMDARSDIFGDIYVQRVDSAGILLWTANGVAICTDTNSQRYPVLVTDGSGGAIITWEDYRSGDNCDIYAQRVDSAGVVQGIFSEMNPAIHTLFEAYPNPFQSEMIIRYQILKSSNVELEIYNLAGQKIKTLVDEFKEAGIYRIKWDGRDVSGNPVGNGVYFYRFEAEGTEAVKKIVFVSH